MKKMKTTSLLLFFTYLIPFLVLSQNKTEHEVKPKETLYSISKKYNVSINELKNLNPTIEKNGLQPSQILVIKKENVADKNNQTNNTYSNNTNYSYAKIKSKETLYSLTKTYDLTEKKLLELNPSIKNGLKIGDSIRLPKENKPEKTVQEPLEHLVKKKETIYSITKQYNLTEDEIYSLNPKLKSKGLQPNTYLIISDKAKNQSTQVISRKPVDKSIYENIHVVLMLPFTSSENKETLQKISSHFLIGSKIAIDSLSKQGKKIHLKVFDTKNDELELKNFLSTYDFSTVDAVIGPMFKKEIEIVANAMDKKIPIISPIATSEELLEYQNLIIAEPSVKDVADKILVEVNENYLDEKIIILTTEKEQKIANYTKDEFVKTHPNAVVTIIYDVDNFQSEGILIDTENQKNGFTTILASEDNVLGEKYINYLYNNFYLKNITNVKSYGIGYIPVYDKKITQLKKTGFVYSMSHRINIYGTDEKELIKKIKKIFCEEPTKNMEIGFDITYDILDRMNNVGQLWNNINKPFIRFSTKYEYQKVKNAYMNKGVRLVKLYDNKIEKPSLID